jgi:hypothetical protein
MKNKNLISMIVTIFALSILGCSGSGNPIASSDRSPGDLSYNSPPVAVTDYFTDGSVAGGMGSLGLFQLHVDPINLTGELTSLRRSALTDVLEAVDITNFLRLAPCTDCAKLKSISIDADGNLVLSVGIRHPFNAGDPLKPISGRNRGDLHVFNIEGIVISDAPGISFPGIGGSTSGLNLLNADGFTGYLDNSIDEFYPTDATVHPYIMHFDDYSAGNFDASNPMGFESVTTPPPSGNLVMAMGCDYNYQDYVLDLDESTDIIFAIGCTYAVSAATKVQRFSPEYRVPQHNKKAASEVRFEIISNGLKSGDTSSSAQIEVDVVDISHGVPVGTALNEMFADSSVNNISIEVPGVTASPVIIDGSTPVSGTGHDPSDPLVYQGTITNYLGAAGGNYPGLIKVTDNYAPGQNTSPLLNGMDGIKRVDPLVNPLAGLFDISEFSTYQVFKIEITEGVQFAVVSPNGGETLWMALYHEITWNPGPGGIDDVKIEWSTDNFVSDIRTIIASTPNDGSYTWALIPNIETTTARIRITDVLGSDSDTSDDDFSIARPVWLEFQDELGITNTSITWNYCWLPYVQSFDEISPALSQDINGPVHLVWHGQTAFNPLPNGPWMAHDVTIRSQDGSSWNGEADCLHTEGGAYPGEPVRTDTLKLAAGSNNTTFAAVIHWHIFFVPDVNAWQTNNFQYNWTLLQPQVENNCELMADDTYLYLVGDRLGSGIYCQRVVTPNPVWTTTSVVTYSNFGEVSHVRSWAIQSGQLVLAFYTTSGQIKLLRQTDKTFDTWDDTEVIFSGSGYTECKDPALAVDADGRLFAAWTSLNSSTNQYEILVSMKPTNTGTWSTPIVAASSDLPFNDTHVSTSVDEVLLPTGDSEYMVLIGYENNGVIQSQISPKDLWAFLPPEQVNTSSVPMIDPDVLCPKAPYGFDAVFAWSFEVTAGDLGVGDHDVVLRNADFATP